MPTSNTHEKYLTDINREIVEKEQEAENLVRSGQLSDAIIDGYFRSLMCPTFLFRGRAGNVIGLDAFLNNLRTDRKIHERKAQDIKVSFADGLDKQAVVTSLVFTLDEKQDRGCFRNVRLFVRDGNRWCLAFWYNYDLTQP